MAGTDDVKKLEMRIARLETLVEKAVATRAPAEISADEVKAYIKVRDVLAVDWGEFCGINDCFRCIVRCLRCITVCELCLRRCDVECVCGPCNIARGGLRGRLSRFSELGE